MFLNYSVNILIIPCIYIYLFFCIHQIRNSARAIYIYGYLQFICIYTYNIKRILYNVTYLTLSLRDLIESMNKYRCTVQCQLKTLRNPAKISTKDHFLLDTSNSPVRKKIKSPIAFATNLA